MLAPKGRIRLVGGGLVLSNMAVKVPALLSSKVLAPGGQVELVVSGGLILRVAVRC